MIRLRKQIYEKTRFTAQHYFSRLIACLRYSSDNYSSLPDKNNRKRFSLCFAAVVNLIYALKYFPDKKLPSVILTVGVFFAMSADIAINLNFIAGAAIFALGHICYFIAYSLIQKPRPTDFIPAIIIFIPIVLFMMFSPLLDFGSVMMKIIGISYAVIICIMTGKAIMNFIRIKNRFNLILALGSVLFLISDIMLLMAYFSKIDFPFSNFCLALYYPGQCLIANGLAHIKTAITEKIRVA